MRNRTIPADRHTRAALKAAGNRGSASRNSAATPRLSALAHGPFLAAGAGTVYRDRTARALLVGALWAMLAVPGWLAPTPAEAQTWRTMTSSRQVWNRDPLDVHVEYGAGRLEMGPTDTPLLYQMEVRYDEETFTPVVEFDEDARTLHLGVRSVGRSRRSLNVREGSAATIAFGYEVPIDLVLKFGAGSAEIELGGIPLRQVAVSTGASETRIAFSTANPIAAEQVSIEAGAADLRVLGLGNTRADRISFQGGVGATVLDFAGEWEQDATASVQIGVGSVTLRLPRDRGVRINRSSFLTSFDAPELERRGNSYYSRAWGTAESSLTIDISAALGSIEIEWFD